jgi:hypothetical protein
MTLCDLKWPLMLNFIVSKLASSSVINKLSIDEKYNDAPKTI